jgi:hypothetical protein
MLMLMAGAAWQCQPQPQGTLAPTAGRLEQLLAAAHVQRELARNPKGQAQGVPGEGARVREEPRKLSQRAVRQRRRVDAAVDPGPPRRRPRPHRRRHPRRRRVFQHAHGSALQVDDGIALQQHLHSVSGCATGQRRGAAGVTRCRSGGGAAQSQRRRADKLTNGHRHHPVGARPHDFQGAPHALHHHAAVKAHGGQHAGQRGLRAQRQAHAQPVGRHDETQGQGLPREEHHPATAGRTHDETQGQGLPQGRVPLCGERPRVGRGCWRPLARAFRGRQRRAHERTHPSSTSKGRW